MRRQFHHQHLLGLVTHLVEFKKSMQCSEPLGASQCFLLDAVVKKHFVLSSHGCAISSSGRAMRNTDSWPLMRSRLPSSSFFC